MEKSDRLYDGIGMTGLFKPSELLGKIGWRLSGHSSPCSAIPLDWRISSLDDKPKCELALKPSLNQVYGNWHPMFDREIQVGLTYDPKSKTFSKETWLNEHLAIRNDSVIGGDLIKNLKALARYNVKLGQADADVDVLAPLDGSIAENINAHCKLNFKDWFVAGNVTINKLDEPAVKAGYEDKELSVIIENTNKTNWDLLVTKKVDPNTVVGMQSNVTTGDFSVAIENVLSDNTEYKLALSSADVLDVEYTKQFSSVTTSLAMQASGLIKTGTANDLKFGIGVEVDL